MTTIATLAVKLIGDVGEYTRAMSTAKSTAQQTATDISRSLKSVGGDLTNAGRGMTTFVTLPLLAAGAAAISYASNLEETKNKVNVVFGDMSASAMGWSQNSATALGMSQQKALDAIGTFGSMGQSAGLSGEQNLKWAESMTQLGSDWASFYNMNPADALGTIQSAVAGQYEPLRRMGVVINQASVEQKALQMGLMQEGGTLSDAARYQAIYALMVEKTSAAQGDFARTSEGVANQQRIARAQFEDAAAALGTQLLPLTAQLLGWISQAITWFQTLSPETQKWILIIAGIVAVAGPVLMMIGGLITAFGAIAGVIGAISTPVLIVIAVIAALIAIGYLLYTAWQNNWGGIQGVVQWVVTYISTIVRAWQAAFHGDWRTFGELLRQAWDMAWKLISTVVSNAWTTMKGALTTLVTSAVNFVKNFDWASAGRNIVLGVANGISNSTSFVINAINNMGQAALDAIKGFFGIESPSRLMQDEIAPWIAKGAFNLAPHMNVGLFEPAFGRVPGLMRSAAGGMGGMGALAGAGAIGSGVAIHNYGGQIDVRVDKDGNVIDDLVQKYRGARL